MTESTREDLVIALTSWKPPKGMSYAVRFSVGDDIEAGAFLLYRGGVCEIDIDLDDLDPAEVHPKLDAYADLLITRIDAPPPKIRTRKPIYGRQPEAN